MFPILYRQNETDFSHNGLGVLSGAITAIAEEEANGLFELKIEYDFDGFLANQIDYEMIIKAKVNDKQDYQLFRVYAIDKSHSNDSFMVYAQHITYDLGSNFVEGVVIENQDTDQAMKSIQSRLAYPTKINLSSTNTDTISSTKLYRTNPLQMIAGMEGSILDNWGGEIERDNFNIIMHKRRGSDDGVLVSYKKNITGLEAKFDMSSLVTRIYPFKITTEGEIISLSQKYIDSPNIDKYEKIYIQPVDYSNDEDVLDVNSLYAKSKDYFKTGYKDVPSVSMDVEFEPLWDTEEYKNVAALERVGMGDTITVRHSKMNVDVEARTVKLEYDVIAEKNAKVTVGEIQARFSDSVNQIGDVEDSVKRAEDAANRAIESANGKNKNFFGPNEPVNPVRGDLWFKEVDGKYERTYQFDGIQWQLKVSIDVEDAIDQSAEARARANEAVANANLAIQNVQSAFDNAENATRIANEASAQVSVFAQTIDGFQTIVANKADSSTVTQLAGLLESKLSTADADRIFVTQSLFNQTSTNINLRVETITNRVDAYQLSGRNFVLDGTGTKYNRDRVYFEINTAEFKKYVGQKVTYSFDAWAHSDDNVQVISAYLAIADTNTYFAVSYMPSFTATGKKERHSFTFTLPEDASNYNKLRLCIIGSTFVPGGEGNAGWFYAEKAKIEVGEIATYFTPAPESIVGQNDVINQINLSKEEILIDGNKLRITAQTFIEDASIDGAKIRNLDAGQITTGYLNADRINGGTIRGVNLVAGNSNSDYQISILSSSLTSTGSDSKYNYYTQLNGGRLNTRTTAKVANNKGYDEIFLTPYEFKIAHGASYNDGSYTAWQTLRIGINGDTDTASILVQGHDSADAHLQLYSTGDLILNALKWTYIGNLKIGKARGVVPKSTISIYDKTTYTEEDLSNIPLAKIQTDIVGSLYADNNVSSLTVYGTSLAVRTYDGSGLGNFVAKDIRASGHFSAAGSYTAGTNGSFGTDDGYVVLRSGSTSYVYLQGLEVRCTKPSKPSEYIAVRGTEFIPTSLAEYKQDITEWKGSALDLINSATLYNYRLKSDVEDGIDRVRQGLVIGKGYNTPDGIVLGDGIGQYLMGSWAWKAIQELSTQNTDYRKQNEQLVMKVSELENRLSKLEVA